ncbi:MAG TPA: PilZ domain-containing protein [Pyrinomonadaceae bacterium]|nr:PilZ domain-containing protein [Pyrinomonadaceae bacterium]
MSNFFSRLLDALREGIGGDRRAAERYHLEERLTVGVERPNVGGRPSNLPTVVYGYTRDVSETGLALVLPELNVGTYHFAVPGRSMRIRLKLPSGPIEMQVEYVRDAELKGEAGHLVGVRILKMSREARSGYLSFLKSLGWTPEASEQKRRGGTLSRKPTKGEGTK